MGAALILPALPESALPDGVWYDGTTTTRRRVPKKFACYISSSGLVGRFDDLEEAKAAHEDYLADLYKAKFRGLKRKRAADVARHRDSLARERDACIAVVEAWKEITGLPALVLQDFTRADVLLSLDKDGQEFVGIQVKSTEGKRKSEGRNGFRFANVKGYSGLGVLCVDVKSWRYWLFDGKALERRKSDYLTITPRRKSEREALAFGKPASSDDQPLASLVADLKIHAQRQEWAKVKEWEGRQDIKSKNQRLEMESVKQLCSLWPSMSFSWPVGQQGTADLLLHTPLDSEPTRLQMKTAIKGDNWVNHGVFECKVGKYAGKDAKGDHLHKPYSSFDFDYLVAVAQGGTSAAPTVLVWVVPMQVLVAQRVVSSHRCSGETKIHLHQYSVTTHMVDNCWTATYFKGEMDCEMARWSEALEAANLCGRISLCPGGTPEEEERVISKMKSLPSFNFLFFAGGEDVPEPRNRSIMRYQEVVLEEEEEEQVPEEPSKQRLVIAHEGLRIQRTLPPDADVDVDDMDLD